MTRKSSQPQRRKLSLSEKIFYGVSIVLVLSMVLGLVGTALSSAF